MKMSQRKISTSKHKALRKNVLVRREFASPTVESVAYCTDTKKTHSNPTSIHNNYSKPTRGRASKICSKCSKCETGALKAIDEEESCTKIFDRKIAKKSKALRDKNALKEKDDVVILADDDDGAFLQSCFQKTMEKFISENRLSKKNDLIRKQCSSELETDKPKLKSYNREQISINTKENSLLSGGLIITKSKVTESELFDIPLEITVEGEHFNFESQRELYATLVHLQGKHQFLKDEYRELKTRLKSIEDCRGENVLLCTQIENLQLQITKLKLENESLEEQLSSVTNKCGGNVSNNNESQEVVIQATYSSTVDSTQSDKVIGPSITLTERVVIVEKAIEDITTILKLMKTAVVQQKFNSEHFENSFRQISKLSTISIVQNLVNDLTNDKSHNLNKR